MSARPPRGLARPDGGTGWKGLRLRGDVTGTEDGSAQAELDAADARSGGNPDRAPRSLHAVELEADDEAIASSDEWDDPERL